jgi:hypothetical protein
LAFSARAKTIIRTALLHACSSSFESCPILGAAVYETALRQVIASYWRDFDDHEPEFMPIFLVNDLSGYWKVLCVSYEAAGPPASDVEKSQTAAEQLQT